MNRNPHIITVDGPAGAGKSTAARDIAQALGYRHIDTGSMYRAAAWGAYRQGIPLDDERALKTAVARMRFRFSNGSIFLNGTNVTDLIRSPEAGQAASQISTHPSVRTILVRRQQRLAREGRVVMEGRDIGTIVLPRAPMKFFLDASPEERGRRRWEELKGSGVKKNLKDITEDIRARDYRDRTRTVGPLRPAADAVLVDTTHNNRDDVKKILLGFIKKKWR